MKKGRSKAPGTKPEPRKDELTRDELDKAVGGLASLRDKSFDPQPEPPGKLQITRVLRP